MRDLDLFLGESGPTRPDQLEALAAAAARASYVQCYRLHTGDATYGSGTIPRWDGGEDAFGRRHSGDTWTKLAKAISELEATPWEYCNLQFAQSSRIPTPPQLCGEAAKDRWRAVKVAGDKSVQQQLTVDQHQLQVESIILQAAGWTIERAGHYVLANCIQFDISPLFAYCTAFAKEWEEVWQPLEDTAAVQYLYQSSSYNRVWGVLLPQRLLSRVDHWVAEMA